MSSAASTPRRLARGEVIALSIALAWSIALVVAAFVLPVYGSDSQTSTGARTHGSDTLAGVNGARVGLVVGVPLLFSAATIGVLAARGRLRSAGPVAWILAGLTVAFSLVAVLSIGPFVLPVAACLIYACAVHGTAAHSQPR